MTTTIITGLPPMTEARKTISPAQAVTYAAKKHGLFISAETIRLWCIQHRIGYQMGKGKYGRYRIYEHKLQEYLSGKSANQNANSPSPPAGTTPAVTITGADAPGGETQGAARQTV
jgi:hypothetical protein